MELLSALDNVLSQKAEDTLTEFAAVKKADVQLQTQLGNRQGQIAANIIGAGMTNFYFRGQGGF